MCEELLLLFDVGLKYTILQKQKLTIDVKVFFVLGCDQCHNIVQNDKIK